MLIRLQGFIGQKPHCLFYSAVLCVPSDTDGDLHHKPHDVGGGGLLNPRHWNGEKLETVENHSASACAAFEPARISLVVLVHLPKPSPPGRQTLPR